MASDTPTSSEDNDSPHSQWETVEPTPIAHGPLRRFFVELAYRYRKLRTQLSPPVTYLEQVRLELIALDEALRNVEGELIPALRGFVGEAIAHLETYERHLDGRYGGSHLDTRSQAAAARTFTNARWEFFEALEVVIDNLHREVGPNKGRDPWLSGGPMQISPALVLEFFHPLDGDYRALRLELAPSADQLRSVRSSLLNLEHVLHSCMGVRDMRDAVKSAARSVEYYERLQRAEESLRKAYPKGSRTIEPKTITQARKRFLEQLDRVIDDLSEQAGQSRGN